jgi:outer membrane lipoprotein-sorting protein
MKRIILFLFFAGLLLINVLAQDVSAKINIILDDLEKIMAETKTIQTDFIQEKNLALFNQKIILRGKVFIQKPGLLSWRTASPMRYSMVINGNTISQWDEDTNQVQQVSLEKNPAFQAAIAQMQNWFYGTFKSMADNYKITLLKQHPIILEFIPLEKSAAGNFIKRVMIIFQDDQRYVKSVNIEEQNGDSTVLSFLNTKLNQAISPKVWEVKTDVR